MSNAEHLIENAITCLQESKTFEDFLAIWHTPIMCGLVGISPEDVWKMAMHVYYEFMQ